MSFYHWSSILGGWQGITLALYASVLMHRLDSESSDSEESILGAGGSSSDSSNSSNSSICSNSNSMSSSDSFSSLEGMGSIDSTLVLEEVIQVSVQMYECMETGMEDNTIQWGKRF